MPENTPAGATPAATGATPVQTPPTGGTAGAGTQPATGAPDDDQPLSTGGTKALKAERDARDQAEKRAKAAEDELEKFRTANMTDAERRDKRLAELEREQAAWQLERQDFQTRESVITAATRLGFADPADAFGLVDRAAIEFDSGGKPKNVDKLLGDLIAAKPYLAGGVRPGGSFDGGPRGQPTSGVNMNDFLRRAAGRS